MAEDTQAGMTVQVRTPEGTRNTAGKPRMGGLTLVGTPIGNMGDISPRAVEALAAADIVCAEDTRVTGRLLSALGIEAKLERCDENVMARRAPQLVDRMLAGLRVAFASDAGMPAVADPGSRLVDACIEAGVPVDVVPGPSAVTCAIAHAGFSCESFYFGGFLPRKDRERDKLLESLSQLPAVLVFYESPHRAAASLAAVARTLPQRKAALARELTKLHQEVLRGPVGWLAEQVAGRESLKGEVVIVVDAPSDRDRAEAAAAALPPIEEAARLAAAAGAAKSAIARQLANDYGMTRSQAYDEVLRILGQPDK